MDDIKNGPTKDESMNPKYSGLDRRDLMKLGVGAGVAVAGILAAQTTASAQQGAQPAPISPQSPLAPRNHGQLQIWPDIRESQEVSATTQIGYTVYTGPGWKNNSNRANGNGPMDECSRRIVEWGWLELCVRRRGPKDDPDRERQDVQAGTHAPANPRTGARPVITSVQRRAADARMTTHSTIRKDVQIEST